MITAIAVFCCTSRAAVEATLDICALESLLDAPVLNASMLILPCVHTLRTYASRMSGPTLAISLVHTDVVVHEAAVWGPTAGGAAFTLAACNGSASNYRQYQACAHTLL